MRDTYSISASIICSDFLKLEQQIKELEKNSIEYIHFDVMDGVFVPRYGLCPEFLSVVRSCTSIPIELHMMTVNAESHIDTFVKSGATSMIVHNEADPHIMRTLQNIHRNGMQAGVALNPGTTLSVLDYILDELDIILLMGFNPGVLGQQLLELTFQKINDLKVKIGDRNIVIEIDGGVTFQTASHLLKLGATRLVCGSSTIFHASNSIENNIVKLRQLIETQAIFTKQ